MLKAIGMSPGRIVGLIVAETTVLALVASAVGTAGGLLLDLYMVQHGVDLSGFTGGISFGDVGVTPVVYGAVTVRGVVLPTAILALTSFLASFYPAARAGRLRPAVGMRET
jgi:ABC-type lipoprotein release transport system permease subunit